MDTFPQEGQAGGEVADTRARKVFLWGLLVAAVAFSSLAPLRGILSQDGFMPNGHCYLWRSDIVLINVVSDSLIALSYLAIAGILVYLVRRSRRMLPFDWMLLALGAFIVACGATHLMEVWTVWHPTYWLAGQVKILTAVASVATAVALPALVPRVLSLMRAEHLAVERESELLAARENERLLERERIARQEAEHARHVLEEVAAFERKLLTITDAALAPLPLEQLLRTLNQRVKSVIGSDTVAVLLLGRDNQLHVRAVEGLDEVLTRTVAIPLGRGFTGRVAERRQPWVVENIDDVELINPYLRRRGVRSLAGVPMIAERKVVGVLHVGSVAPRRFTDREIQLLQLAAERMALAIERAVAAESEEKGRYEAEAANRAKDDFLAVLSHELRTPLNAMLSWVKLLQRGLNREQTQQAFGAIERNLHAQTRLINELVDISRIVSGKLHLERAPLEVCGLADECMKAIGPLARARDISLECRADTPLFIEGDKVRLAQVLTNLLTNSVKFTRPGDRIRIEVRKEEGQAVIRVEDTGEGIDPALLPHIFERFRQADSSIRRPHGGLGLGLTIVKHIVEAHGGTIRAESEGRDRGTFFTIRLPIGDLTRHPQPERMRARQADISGERILLVEDEADSREALTIALSQRGADVRTAGSVDDALEIFEQWEPRVIISDIAMPERDGYELISTLRQREHETGRKRARAIAITGFAGALDREQALDAGFDDHLAKPIDPFLLLARIADTDENCA